MTAGKGGKPAVIKTFASSVVLYLYKQTAPKWLQIYNKILRFCLKSIDSFQTHAA